MPIFDVRCLDCQHKWEAFKAYQEAVACPECQSTITKTLMSAPSVNLNRLPMDQIHKSMSLPGAKKVKSFANDRRKGGKDTT
jgi:putative FmdB family regulatory protein